MFVKRNLKQKLHFLLIFDVCICQYGGWLHCSNERVKKAQRCGYLPRNFPDVSCLVDALETNLFNSILYKQTMFSFISANWQLVYKLAHVFHAYVHIAPYKITRTCVESASIEVIMWSNVIRAAVAEPVERKANWSDR